VRNVTRQRLLVVTYALFTVVSNSYATITGGEVAEKGGNPEMEVAGLDICVSVCSRIKNHKKYIRRSLKNLFANVRPWICKFALSSKKSQP
jgi:hypothetical protein